MSYSQNSYPKTRLGTGPYTIAEAGCFLISDCNILERLGINVNPVDLNNYFIQHGVYVDVDGDHTMDDLAWSSISAYNSEVTCQVGSGGWPDSNDAIVKFSYVSPRTGQRTTHFCAVVDRNAQTILDSWDNKIKVNPYGTPVAWAKYERHQAPVVQPAPQTPAQTPSFRIEHIPEVEKTLRINTHLWDLTQRSWPGLSSNPVSPAGAGTRFKTSAIAHHMVGGDYYLTDPNGSDGYNVVDCENYIAPPEQPAPVQAPVATPAVPTGPRVWNENTIDGITYEAETNPVRMFVTKLGGTEKWTLSGVKSWRDFKSVQHYDYGAEVFIAGIAHHPIPPVGADYFMTGEDFGDFKQTGRPTNNYGFNHADLDTSRPPAITQPPAAPVAEKVAVTVAPPPAPAQPVEDWRSTYRAFVDSEGNKTPIKYIALKNVTVKPLDGKGPEVPLYVGDLIIIGGTFKGPDGKIRLRPEDAATRLMWHAILDDGTVEPHDKVMSTKTTADERRVLGTTTVNDRIVFVADDIDKIFDKIKVVSDIIRHKNKKTINKK